MDEPDTPTEKQHFRRLRRSEHGGPVLGLFVLPHLVTTAGLFFGFYAIVQAFNGRPGSAATGILAAAACDAMDGRLARLTHSTSRFGLEYDSIADTVSFGVAPAMLAFSAGHLQVLGRTGWVLAFLFTACAALRLARFNVAPGRYRGRFEGLPSPAAAGMVATTVWFAGFLRKVGFEFSAPEGLVAVGTAVVGLLMVTAIPYRNFKEIDLRHSYGTMVAMVIAIALVIAQLKVTLFVIFLAYCFSGPVEWVWRRRTGRVLEPSEPKPQPAEQGVRHE